MKKWVPLHPFQTKPPIPYPTIHGIIRDIEQSNELLIDGRVLGTALKFAYFLGFRKREILGLRVKHVLDANQTVHSAIVFDGETISIPGSFTQTVTSYCSYLGKYRKKLLPDWPFFPDRKRDKPYDEATIVRHINYFSKDSGYDITIEKIRQSGICRFYDDLGATQPGYYVQFDALESTAKFARVNSIIHAHNILIGKIDLWGNRPKQSVPPPVVIQPKDLIEQMIGTGSLSEAEAIEIIEKDFPKAHRSISKLEELRNEFITVIGGAANMGNEVRESLMEKFDAQLQSIGFVVNQNGRLSPLENVVYED